MESFKNQIIALLVKSIQSLGITDVIPQVIPAENPQNGDYSTNVCLILAGRLKQKPEEIAKKISEVIRQDQKESKTELIKDIKIASPGFLNFYVNEANFISHINSLLIQEKTVGRSKKTFPIATVSVIKRGGKKASKSVLSVASTKENKGLAISKENATESLLDRHVNIKLIMVEFAHPNTHKAFHIGHLRNITTGESVVRLLEAIGISIIRANYQGDVGMHIAKALYGIKNTENTFSLASFFGEWKEKSVREKVDFLGKAYAYGSQAYETGGEAQETIRDYNYLIYASAQRFNKDRGISPSTTDYMKFVHGRRLAVEEIYALWKETRQWSLDYFQSIYKRLGTTFDRLYFESECLAGVDLARDAISKGVLEESEGAVIFNGKPYGLDSRVFVNNLGLPTYEGKELALATMELSDYGHLDKLIHVVGPEQSSFFQVTFMAEKLLGLQSDQQYHLIYGWVKLKHGKMSSRTGNVVLGEWLIDEAKKEISKILDNSSTKYTKQEKETIAEKAAVGAVKYSFLRVGTKQEIAFDLKESVNLNGDSGPYLQYTYARCKSVLRKITQTDDRSKDDYKLYAYDTVKNNQKTSILPEERNVLRRLGYFEEIVVDAAYRLTPNILCTYLYSLASEYNNLYAHQEILGNPFRTTLTAATAIVISRGLYLLGIETLERM